MEVDCGDCVDNVVVIVANFVVGVAIGVVRCCFACRALASRPHPLPLHIPFFFVLLFSLSFASHHA